MSLSLFFTYANTSKDKAHYETLAKSINPFVKSKSGVVLNCDDNDLLDNHADNAQVIVVLVSSDYLNYDSNIQRQKLHDKISRFLFDQTKLVIPIEVEDCDWVFEPAFTARQVHKLEQVDNSGYMKIVRKIREEIENHKPKVSYKKILNEGLFRLNYDEQRASFNAHFKELNLLNILLMRGTPECGQHLLLKTFLRFQKIDFKDEQKLIWLNAKNFAFDQSDEWIWQQIAEKFGLFPQNITLAKIGQYVIDRLQKEPIFIRFDDIHLVKKESLEVIKKMWEQLHSHISNRDIAFKHQIFLFVTDRSGSDEDYAKHQFGSIENAAICEKILCILPKTKFLNQKDTKTWLNTLSHDPDLQLISQTLELKHILPSDSEDLPIARAIGNMIDILGEFDEDLKNNKNDFLARI